MDIHTKLLTHKWHELLVLTTSAYQAIHGSKRMGTTRTDGEKVELHQEVIAINLSSKYLALHLHLCGRFLRIW